MTEANILYCECAHTQLVQEADRAELRKILGQIPDRVVATADLCGLVAEKNPLLDQMAKAPGLTVIACYPRGVLQLFQAAGIQLDPERVKLLNQRTSSPSEIARELGLDPAPADVEPIPAPKPPNPTVPWFPVIDRTRCVDCKQCLNFCLFDTYTDSGDGHVVVANPLNCKLNCPACARICPEAAIIFPKYGEAPINGAPIDDESAVKEQIKVNVNQILGSDVYAALQRRKQRANRKLLRPHLNPSLAGDERARFLGGITSNPPTITPTGPPNKKEEG